MATARARPEAAVPPVNPSFRCRSDSRPTAMPLLLDPWSNKLPSSGGDYPTNRSTWPLVSWDEAEGACSARWPAGVVRMIDAIHDRYIGEIEWAYPV